MKLRKLISCVAAASVATAALATAVSAELVTVEQNGIFFSQTGMWMPVLYSDGTVDAKDKDIIDYGLDLSKIGSVEVTYRATDTEWFEGNFGGALVLSSQKEGDKTHNWNAKDFWGVNDEAIGINTVDEGKAMIAETLGDYTYKIVMPVDDTNSVIDGAQLVQIAFQDYNGGDFSPIEVVSMVVKDTAGAEMISFDANGNASIAPVKHELTAGTATETETETPAADEEEPKAPSDDPNALPFDLSSMYTYDFMFYGTDYTNTKEITFVLNTADDEDFGGGIMFNGTACGWDQREEYFFSGPDGDKDLKCTKIADGKYELTVAIPDGIFGTYTDEDFYAQVCLQKWWGSDPIKVAGIKLDGVDVLPAKAGDVDASTDSTKGSPDTGVADVAVVAGLALVAGGAFIVAKKRK